MKNSKIAVIVLAALCASVLVGGIIATLTSRFVSHVSPSGVTQCMVYNNEIPPGACSRLRSDIRDYGWPYPAYSQRVYPGAEKIAKDWYVPVLDTP